MRANVYFTREITPEKVVELYRALGVELPGKVAVKVHSGEKGNQNFLLVVYIALLIICLVIYILRLFYQQD